MGVAASEFLVEVAFHPICCTSLRKSNRPNTARRPKAHNSERSDSSSDSPGEKIRARKIPTGQRSKDSSTGVRRDRTKLFASFRNRRGSHGQPFIESMPSTEKLKLTFETYSQTTASLCQQLTQLEGLLRFSSDLKAPVASLEMRMYATDAPGRIGEHLDALQKLKGELSVVLPEQSEGPSYDLIRGALAKRIEMVLDTKRSVFEEQIGIIRELRIQDPLRAPTFSPGLKARLSLTLGASHLSPMLCSPRTTANCSDHSPPWYSSSVSSACSSPKSRCGRCPLDQSILPASHLRLPTLLHRRCAEIDDESPKPQALSFDVMMVCETVPL